MITPSSLQLSSLEPKHPPKKQGDTEIIISELSMGRRVKTGSKRQWLELQKRISGIAGRFNDFLNEKTELEYLQTISYNISMQRNNKVYIPGFGI